MCLKIQYTYGDDDMLWNVFTFFQVNKGKRACEARKDFLVCFNQGMFDAIVPIQEDI